MSVVLIVFGAGMARSRSVAIFFNEFCVSYPNEMYGTVGFGSSKIYIISVID